MIPKFDYHLSCSISFYIFRLTMTVIEKIMLLSKYYGKKCRSAEIYNSIIVWNFIWLDNYSSTCNMYSTALFWTHPSFVLSSFRKSFNVLTCLEWWWSTKFNSTLSLFCLTNDVVGKRVALRLMKYKNRMTRQNIHQNVVKNRVEMDWNMKTNVLYNNCD